MGTGTSTVVLAETILQIQKKDPSYNCKIVSMESVQEWYDMASQLLPKNYSKIRITDIKDLSTANSNGKKRTL